MSLLTRLRDAFVGDLHLPMTDSLANRPVHALGGSPASFDGFDDPALLDYFKAGRVTTSGVLVNEQVALRNSAIYRAANLICSSMGMLPLHLFKIVDVETEEDDGEGGKKIVKSKGAEKAKDHPVYRILAKRPNSFQTPFEFKSYMVMRALFDGIAYAYKLKTVDASVKGGLRIKALVPLDPKKVTPKLLSDWTLVFEVQFPDGKRTIRSEDMFWFRSPISSDGVTGVKLLDVAAETIGLAIQAERASGNVLKNGALVGGVLQHPKALDEPAVNRLRTQFEERQSSPENAGKWIVAEDGLEVKPFGSTLKDAQTNEQRKFQIEEVGRFTNVPRPLLFLDETSWGSGIEQLGLFFITYCLLAWFITIEEAIARSLLSEEEQDDYFVKFNDGALLRGSLESQASFFSKALGAGGGHGWMDANEVRDKFNLNPKEDGNVLPKPTNKAATDPNAEPSAEPGGTPPGGTKPAGKPPKGAGGNGA